MAAVLPESKSKVLEEGVEAILPEPEIVEGEEFASLDPEEKKEPAPAVKKPAAAPAKKEKVEPAPSTDDELPDDLKGKTPAQIAKMLKEAQSLIGRQGNELGEFRRKADLLIQTNLAAIAARKAAEEPAPKKEAEPELDDTEFFANPKAAIAKAFESNPIIKEIREKLGQAAADSATLKATEATARFNAAHPDAAEIMQDPEFRTWIQASRVRTALLHRAHSKFDFDAGDEVFGTWKALKGVKKPEAAAETTAPTSDDTRAAAKTLAAAAAAKRKQELAAATAPTGGSAGGGKAEGGKKIYRRADVLRLMEEDPDRYEALAPEITLAYAEGRVR
jgi:hypothetical protein